MQPSEAAELLHFLLAKLPPRDRLLLTLMYLEELPVARVAELTGWTKTLVKVQAHRAKAKLRKLTDGLEVEP
ncbi:MAG: sigma-70 region 4 domain-containing protein [Planctomycetes bacterium]|nr:sigma-70 region 4 domain-containing protein [Planctomycetota bacterium]